MLPSSSASSKKRFARKPRRAERRESDGGVLVSFPPAKADDDEKIIVESNAAKKRKQRQQQPETSDEKKSKNKKSSDDVVVKGDPYAFENAKELFGKVDEEVLAVDEDSEEEDVEAQAEKYFVSRRKRGGQSGFGIALFGKSLLMKSEKLLKEEEEEEVVQEKKEETQRRRRVSFAMDDDDGANDEEEAIKIKEEIKIIPLNQDSPLKSPINNQSQEVLFDEALATEIKLTPEKPIQFKRQKTPSPVKQIVVAPPAKKFLVQSSDPQTHLQVLEKHGSDGINFNGGSSCNFQEREQRTLASTLWLLKKIASNTQYRRRLSRERPHFATSMFTAALKIAGKSATDANLRLAAIALAYLFSLEIKTFSRALDEMDIAVGVAACVDEANFFIADKQKVNGEIVVIGAEDDDKDSGGGAADGGVDHDDDVEKTVETSLSALKFLPNEKSACTKNIALLLAFRALQWGSEEEEENEETERREGKQGASNNKMLFGGDATSRALRTRLSRSGFITSVAKLANESCKDLVQSMHSSKMKKHEKTKGGEDAMKAKARKSCARLFRCARVMEAATYASPETVTTLASSNLPVWESFASEESKDVAQKRNKNREEDEDDDAFGEPSPSDTNASEAASSLSVLKLAEVSLLEMKTEEEEEEEEEDKDKDDGQNLTTIPTSTAVMSTPPRPIPGSKGEERDKDNNNNNSFLQIGSPATVGASPIFGQMAKSPGAALDSWLAKSPKDGVVDNMSPIPKGAGAASLKNNNDKNNNNRKNNWSLARCLIETLPTLTLLTSRSMRPRAKTLHGIQTSEYLNPNIDVRLSLATLKACVFALTNSTNENAVGARAAASRDGLHGIVAAIAYYSTMRGCALYGEFAGFVPKKDNMEGTVPDAYKEAATELLHACMCLLVNITEANPRAKKELLQLQLDCAPFGVGKAEDFKKKKAKSTANGKKASNDEKSASPLVPFPTVLARIFTHAGGAKMHRAEEEDEDDDDQSLEAEGEDGDGDDDDEVTAEMLDGDDDATANAAVDPSYGEDLITQAYSSLLLAFLVENDREALRRTADQALPKGGKRKRISRKTPDDGGNDTTRGDKPTPTAKNGVQAMVDTLERFHAFHDTLDAMSESSSASLKRVVEWLKSTLVS